MDIKELKVGKGVSHRIDPIIIPEETLRNVIIYFAFMAGHKCKDIAEDLHISKQRVSKIVIKYTKQIEGSPESLALAQKAIALLKIALKSDAS